MKLKIADAIPTEPTLEVFLRDMGTHINVCVKQAGGDTFTILHSISVTNGQLTSSRRVITTNAKNALSIKVEANGLISP